MPELVKEAGKIKDFKGKKKNKGNEMYGGQ